MEWVKKIEQRHIFIFSSMLVTGALYIPFALAGFFLLRKVFVEDKPKSIFGTKSVQLKVKKRGMYIWEKSYRK